MSHATALEDLERLGEGREAETFAWGEGQILRLMRDPSHTDRLEREELALAAASPVGSLCRRCTVAARLTVGPG